MAAQIPPHCPTRWPAGLLMVRTRVVFCHWVLPSNTRCNCCAFYSQLEWWPSRRVNSRRTSLFITKISQRSQGQTTKQKTPPALAKTAKRWLSVQVSLWLFLLWLNLLNLYCLHQQNLNSSGKPTSNSDGPKFPGDKSSVPSNNNQQKKGIQVLPDGRESTAWPRSYKYFSLNSTLIPFSAPLLQAVWPTSLSAWSLTSLEWSACWHSFVPQRRTLVWSTWRWARILPRWVSTSTHQSMIKNKSIKMTDRSGVLHSPKSNNTVQYKYSYIEHLKTFWLWTLIFCAPDTPVVWTRTVTVSFLIGSCSWK